jgi:hypothetical protein
MGMLNFLLVICDKGLGWCVFDGKFYIVRVQKTLERMHKCVKKEGFLMSETRILNKTVTTTLIFLLTLSMLGVLASHIKPVHATPYDLTPDYAKAGAIIDILNFTIVGPTDGTTLTSVTVAYTGTNLTDLSYASVYVSTDGGAHWALFGWAWAASFSGTPPTTTISGSYFIGEDVKATVKLTFRLSSTPTHGHTVDGKVTTYTLTCPPGDGTDSPPIDPDGETKIDTSAPTVTVTYPTAGTKLRGGSCINITWEATDHDDYTPNGSLLINIDYRIGGGSWNLIASNLQNITSYSWTVPRVDSDSVQVRVTAFDLAGNSGLDTSGNFTIDSTKPTISNLTPAPGSYINTTTTTISAVLSNGLSGINSSSIIMKLDENLVEHTYDSTTKEVSYKATGLTEGNHTVYIYVEDNAGNSANATWSFIVDTIPPGVVVIWPNGNETLIGGETYEIRWNASDLHLAPNPISIDYSINGGVSWIPIVSNLPNTGSYNWTVPGVISNNSLVRVRAVDLAGNVGHDESNATFTITYIPKVTTVTVSASPDTVPADGVTESTITATVLDQCNNIMKGVRVTFTTTLGTLSNVTASGTTVTATTNEAGVATVTLTSTTRGTATVTATADSISDTVEVYFYGAAGIEDVMDMLATIRSDIDKLELKFHEGGSFWTFINNWFTTIQNAMNAILGAIGAIDAKLGSFSEGDTVASLLYEIKASIQNMNVTVNLTPILNELRNETYGLAAIKNAVSNLSEQLSSAVESITSSLSDIKTTLGAIKQKTDTINWQDITYIKNKLDAITAPQVTSGGGSTTFTSSGTSVIYEGAKVGTVTVSLKTTGVSYGERLRIRYYTDPNNPTVYIEKTVVSGTNTLGWTDTAAAWKVEIAYTWSSGTDTVYWSYSAIHP